MTHKPMHITLSCAGAFHAFNLADQLERHGVLGAFFTTYPKGYIEKRFRVKLDPRHVRSSLLVYPSELISRAAARFPRLIGTDATSLARVAHDYVAARWLRSGADIFVGWSGCSLATIRRAKSLGITTVVVRGSAHIEEQMRILEAEYAKLGVPFVRSEVAIQRELAEYQEADFIQTNSTFARRSFIAQGFSPERIIMHPTGVDLQSFRQVSKTDDLFRVIYVGGLNFQKGTHYLLQAFSELALPKSELLLIGGISEEIRPWLSRYHASNVKAVGYVPQAQLYQHLSQGSVFAMPSLQEGLATVQAQAMACGLPLVCTANTGGEDFLTANGTEGFVVPAGDVEAFKEKLAMLHRLPALARDMGQAARSRVATGFTWDHYGDRLVATYRQIQDDRLKRGTSSASPRGVSSQTPSNQ